MASRSKRLLIFCTTLLILGVTIQRIWFFKPSFIETSISHITYPFIKSAHWMASIAHEWQQKKITYQELEKKYKIMQQRYDEINQENIELKALIRFHELSKELAEFKERYNTQSMILARVLVRNITNDEHYILIDKGSNNGIQKDMIGLYKHQIVGKVVDVHPGYSKIILITDQNCKVAAYTNQTRAPGIVRGQNVIHRCVMGYVSHLYSIVDNDLVISSGQGLIFPEGFCLGKILHHELNEKNLYHTIELEPIVDLSSIEMCLITHNAQTAQ